MIKLDLGYIVLPVRGDQLSEIQRWYETQLDLYNVSRDDDAVLMAGANGFAVEFRKGRPVGNPERVVLAYFTDDADAMFEEIRRRGFKGKPESAFGARVLRLKDPAGHTVEIYERGSISTPQDLRDARRVTSEDH